MIGCLSKLTSEQLSCLLLCLDASFHVAHEFDQRPGLKFLIQKVFNSTVAANLYKQAVTAWAFKIVTLLDIASRLEDIKPSLVFDICNLDHSKMEIKFSNEEPPVFNAAYYLHQMYDSYFNICQCFVLADANHRGIESDFEDFEQKPLALLLWTPEENCSSMADEQTIEKEPYEQNAAEESETTKGDELINNIEQHQGELVQSDSELDRLIPNDDNSLPKKEKISTAGSTKTYSDDNEETIYKVATEETLNSVLTGRSLFIEIFSTTICVLQSKITAIIMTN